MCMKKIYEEWVKIEEASQRLILSCRIVSDGYIFMANPYAQNLNGCTPYRKGDAGWKVIFKDGL